MNQLQQYNENFLISSNPYMLEEQCQLCDGEPFFIMLRRALYQRYFYSQEQYTTQAVDDLINQQITEQTAGFKQILIRDQEQQYLKRQYKAQQFEGKIIGLSEYYKFHRDVPRIFQISTQKILNKYYDRLRNYDYKIIKKTLKQEQNISLTTQKSQESFDDGTSIQIKSKYSSVLHDLNNDSFNQSIVLKDICKKIGRAFQNLPLKHDFKGIYYSGQKKFQQYLFNLKTNKNQQKSKQPFKKIKECKQIKSHYKLYSNFFNPINMIQSQSRKSTLKKKENLQIKGNQNKLKPTLVSFKKSKAKNGKSIERTTANETISRQEKSKKYQKNLKNLSNQIQKNIGIFKPLSADLIALKSNTMLKTLSQIYQPNSHAQEKYNSDKLKKNPSQSISNMNIHKKYQSKLDHNNELKCHHINRCQSKKQSAKNSKHNSKDMHNLVQNIFLLNNGDTDRRKNAKPIINNMQQLTIKKQSISKEKSKKSLKKNFSANKKSQNQFRVNKAISTNLISHALTKRQGHSTQKIINLHEDQNLINRGGYTERKIERQSSQKILQENIRKNALQRKSVITSNAKSRSKGRRSQSQKNLKRQSSKLSIEKLNRNSSKSSLKKNQLSGKKEKSSKKRKDEDNKTLDKLLEKKLALFNKK